MSLKELSQIITSGILLLNGLSQIMMKVRGLGDVTDAVIFPYQTNLIAAESPVRTAVPGRLGSPARPQVHLQ